MRADLSPDMTREESDRAGYVVCQQHFRPKDINSKVKAVSHRCGSGRQKAAHWFFLLPSISCNKVHNRSPGFQTQFISILFHLYKAKSEQQCFIFYEKKPYNPYEWAHGNSGKENVLFNRKNRLEEGQPAQVSVWSMLSLFHSQMWGHYSPARIKQ